MSSNFLLSPDIPCVRCLELFVLAAELDSLIDNFDSYYEVYQLSLAYFWGNLEMKSL